MSEEIVTCPGCAKKFRLPEGAQSGSFPCTACNANVPYGPAAKSRGPGRPAPAVARPAPAQAHARTAAVAPAREAPSRRAPSSRRASRRDDAPPAKSNPALLWGGIALGVAVIVGAYVATRPSPKPPEPAPQPVAKKPATPAAATTTEAAKPAATKPAEPEAVPPVAPPAPEPPRPVPASNSGPDVKIPVGPDIVRAPDVAVARENMAVLGQSVASVKGMTEEERADMDRAVAVAMDFDSGKDGANAEAKLVKAGKKAMPSILSAFSKQFTNGKWGTERDQWSADKLQDLLHRITGADCPREADFWPKFSPGSLTPPEDFEKACKNWLNWWNMAGAMKEKYKQRND